MTFWIILSALTLAGLCYGFFRLGKFRGEVRPGDPQRGASLPSILHPSSTPRPEYTSFTGEILKKPTRKPVVRIPHDPLRGPPVIVSTKISQGVVAGYFKSKTDPDGEVFTALYYDGTHHDTSIPGGTYEMHGPEGAVLYPATEFEQHYAPAKVGIVVPPETLQHGTPRVPTILHSKDGLETTELNEQAFHQMAEEFDFPTAPRNYPGSCGHTTALEQMKKNRSAFQGIGHFIPCKECGQTFEFISEAETPVPSPAE